MLKRNQIPRAVLLLALFSGLAVGSSLPAVIQGGVLAAPKKLPAAHIVISEFRTRGPNGGNDEFIELHNPTAAAVNIGNWDIDGSNGSGSTGTRLTIAPGTSIPPGGYYLLTNSLGYSGATLADDSYTTGITDDGGIALFDRSDPLNPVIVDQVGMSTGSAFFEFAFLVPLSASTDQSYEREPAAGFGNCIDTDDNDADFVFNSSLSNPQNALSAPVICTVVNNVTSPALDGVYVSGNIIQVTVEFSGVVTVGGAPTLLLETGTTDQTATFTGGSGTNSLTFDYVVQPNDVSVDLDYTGVNSLALNGGTISGVSGDAYLELPIPGSTGSLGANKAIVIDNGVAPTVAVEQAASQADPVTTLPIVFDILFSEPIVASTFTAADITQGGTATGITWSIADSGDHKNFTLSATGATGFGTVIPSIAAGQVLDGAGAGNAASTSVDNTVTYNPVCTTTASTTPLIIVINEVAWAGTAASTSDEWIELYNPAGGVGCIDLTGWVLKAEDGSPTINLTGTILDNGYFLLERTDDNTVSDIAADQIFTDALSDGGERLYLENSGTRIDTANIDGGTWPAGSTSSYRSMERLMRSGVIVSESPATWLTNMGVVRNGLDANGNAINGTPRNLNWAATVTPTPSRTPTPTRTPTRHPTSIPIGRPVINEFLPRPGYDWNQDGRVDVFDEFIEVKNLGPVDINLSGWRLDDEENRGSSPFTLPDLVLKPGERAAFYALETNILLSDGGDTVRLLNPGGRIYDSYTYPIARVEDESFCRLPDGNGSWYQDCTPTPNLTNTREGEVPRMPQGEDFQSPVCELPDTLPADFLFAECRGYGANIWRSMFWDASGWDGQRFVPENTSKWPSFVE